MYMLCHQIYLTENCCGVLLTNGKEEKWYLYIVYIAVGLMPNYNPIIPHKKYIKEPVACDVRIG
jgi:hypothetical protein